MGKVTACCSLDAASTVFLVPHAAHGTRTSLLDQLSSDSSFLAKCQQLLQLPPGGHFACFAHSPNTAILRTALMRGGELAWHSVQPCTTYCL